MAFLDELLSIPGAQAWLSSLLNNASNPRSDLLGAINTGGYSAAGPQTTFNERFSPATDKPLESPPEVPAAATFTAANKPLVPAPTPPQITQAVAPQVGPISSPIPSNHCNNSIRRYSKEDNRSRLLVTG